MRFSADPADLAWTEDGMYELVSKWLLVNVVEHAPDASGRLRDVGHEADEVGRAHQLLEDRAVRLLDDVGVGHVAPKRVHPKAHLGEHEVAAELTEALSDQRG